MPPERRRNLLLRQQRELRDWSLQEAAGHLRQVMLALGDKQAGVNAQMWCRWENGTRRPERRYRRGLCRLFGLPADKLGLLADEERGVWPTTAPPADTTEEVIAAADAKTPRGIDAEAPGWLGNILVEAPDWPANFTTTLVQAVSGGTAEITPLLATRLAHEWLVAESPQVLEARAGRQIGEGLIKSIELRVEQLRHMDDFIGGGDLHELVEKELRDTVGLLNEAAYAEVLGKRLLAAVGELAQLAGWVAADAGRPADAARYYAVGIRAAHAAGDASLAGNLISSLSYLYSNVGDRREAVLLAHTAYAGAKHRASATTCALLQDRIAWAHARVGELRQSERALGEVDRFLARRRAADDPRWVYWLDQDEVDVMAGRCYTELGQPHRAAPLLARVLDHYDENRAREVALYASWLAQSRIQADDLDEAAAQASRVLLLSSAVNSSRGRERVRLLHRQLQPYRHVRAVQEFQELYRELGAS